MGSIPNRPNYRALLVARSSTRSSSMLMRPSLIRRLVFLLLIVLSRGLSAQSETRSSTGRIVGRVIDATSGAGITDADVQVLGTAIGARSGVDGRFTLTNVPAGTVTLQARRLGFATKQVTGLSLEAGKSLEQNISLAAATVRLEAQVVSASTERGSVSGALDAQRTAVGVVSAVTTQQISKR